MKKESLDAARSSFMTEWLSIERMPFEVDFKEIERAVGLLVGAQRIGSSGCGHSGIACQHFAHLMCCIEKSARFISPSEAVHGATGFLQKGDVMLFVSRGGKTSELLPIMEICHRKEVKIISLTENISSPLALGSDVVVKMSIKRETDKFDCQGTTSFTVTNMLFHSIQSAMIEELDYKNEQFALIHPSGAVGIRLNQGR